MNILYEDNHLLVVEKAMNMPVQADSSGDPDLLSACKAYVKEKYNKPGEVYLGLVHRLDRPVGGVMVFARTSKAAARLSAQFASCTAQKRYVAIVCGKPQEDAELCDWLLKDNISFSSMVVPAGTEGAKNAKLSYSLLGRDGDLSLLDIALYTGRPHQIRVQLNHAGFPVVGDQRYNANAQTGEQIKLWAYALTLTHPTLGEPLHFTCLPHGAGWETFHAQITTLPASSVCRGIYHDDEIIVVDKCCGVDVENALVNALSSVYGDVRPLHRLDVNTEGIVTFARTASAQARLIKAFNSHGTKKLYHAIVRGVPKESGTLVHYVQKDAREAMVHICAPDEPGALRCELHFQLLKTDGEKSLVEISLISGRTHQIRVQMAAEGHPLLGDDKYGDRAFNRTQHVKTQRLLAKSLTLNGRTYESCRTLKL